MIEGLRLLPHVADNPYLNCETCLHGDPKLRIPPQTDEARFRQACGRLPRREGVRATFGIPVAVDFEPSTCAGYLVGLPEVQETVRLRPHWMRGTFMARVGDGFDPGPALDAQAILDGAVELKKSTDMEARIQEARTRDPHGGG